MQVLYMDKWIASINCLLFTLHKTFEKGKFRKYKDKISKRNDDNLHFIFKGIVFKPILGHLQILLKAKKVSGISASSLLDKFLYMYQYWITLWQIFDYWTTYFRLNYGRLTLRRNVTFGTFFIYMKRREEKD